MKVSKGRKAMSFGDKSKFWGQSSGFTLKLMNLHLSIPWLNKRPSQIPGGDLEVWAHKHILLFDWNLYWWILKPLSLSTHPPTGSFPSLWATSPEAHLQAIPLITTCKGTGTWMCTKYTLLPAKNTWRRTNNYNPIKLLPRFWANHAGNTEFITTCVGATQQRCETAKGKNVSCMLYVSHFLIIKDKFHSAMLEDKWNCLFSPWKIRRKTSAIY